MTFSYKQKQADRCRL